MKKKTHKYVEFEVRAGDGHFSTFRAFEEAAGHAVTRGASTGLTHFVDVIIFSAAGARWWGGYDAVVSYKADPDASALQRIKVDAYDLGRIS